jgi:DNA-binding PadR family transcriptional regulator
MSTEIPGFGSFAEPALYILVSLSEGSKHGYAIMVDLESATGRPMRAGTLYAVLDRLQERGLIEALPPDARRRPYRLTALGSQVLASELRRLSDLTALGLRRLGEPSR